MSTTKLYLGLNDKDTHLQKHSTNECKRMLMEALMDYDIENFTLQLVDGVYKHVDGTIVIENTFVITICNFDNEYKLSNCINMLKLIFNQECIMREDITSLVKFI